MASKVKRISEEAIKNEIKWCIKNRSKSQVPSQEYKSGFIAGLKQALKFKEDFFR